MVIERLRRGRINLPIIGDYVFEEFSSTGILSDEIELLWSFNYLEIDKLNILEDYFYFLIV